MAVTPARREITRYQQFGLRLVGAALLAATGAIHLDLYLTGYRSIPTIGWLFLLQVIAAFGLSAAVLVSGRRLIVAAGAGFALATLGGYLLSVWIGLFGFTEVRTTAGIVAGVIDVAAFAALAVLAAAPTARSRAAGEPAPHRRLQAGVPHAGPAIAGVCAAALVVLGITVAGAGSPAPATAGALKTVKISGVTVLTDAKGFTLYWFVPDTATRSNCIGTCAAYWPPVKGPATAGSDITGKLGTIKRSDGTIQATYNGHPLYTYVGDGAPGRASGNGLNLNGGIWHEMTLSG